MEDILAIGFCSIACGGDGHKAYHVVSVFISENRVTLEQLKTEQRSNEMTAVPELLDPQGSIVTADAMNCQKKTVEKITEKEADYVFGLKENRPLLLEDTRLYLADCADGATKRQTTGKGHG